MVDLPARTLPDAVRTMMYLPAAVLVLHSLGGVLVLAWIIARG